MPGGKGSDSSGVSDDSDIDSHTNAKQPVKTKPTREDSDDSPLSDEERKPKSKPTNAVEKRAQNDSDSDHSAPKKKSDSKPSESSAKIPKSFDVNFDEDSEDDSPPVSQKRKETEVIKKKEKAGKEKAKPTNANASDSSSGLSSDDETAKKKKNKSTPSKASSLGLSDSDDAAESKKKVAKRKHSEEEANENSDEDESEVEVEQKKKKKLKKGAVSAFFDEEAELSGDDEDDDEEEGADLDDYEYGDFVVREEDEEEVKKEKKKKRTRLRKKRALEWADEDLELIREARGEKTSGREIHYGDEGGGDSEDDGPLMAKEDVRARDVDPEEYGSDADDDFIEKDIDDEGDGDLSQTFRRGPTRQDLLAALDIFGDGAMDFFHDKGPGVEEGDDDEDHFERFDDEGLDTHSKKGGIKPIERGRRSVVRKAAIDPNVKVEKFLTARDQEIRDDDVPERLQLRMPGRGDISDGERADEAEWIFKQLEFTDLKNPAGCLKAIEKVLFYLQEERYEVPFIMAYRKDYFIDYLKHREQLWMIYDLDEKWEQLQSRRLHIETLSTKLQNKAKNTGAAIEELERLSLTMDAAELENFEEESEGELLRRKEKRKLKIENARAEVVVAQKAHERARQNIIDESSDQEDELADVARTAEARVQEAEAAHAAAVSEAQAEEEEEVARAARIERIKHLRAVKARGEAAAQAAPLEIPEQYAKLIAKTADEDLLRDIQDFLGLVQDHDDNADGVKKKRAMRSDRDKYRTCRKAGLRGYITQWALSAPQLGTALASSDYKIPNPPNPDAPPLELADEFVSTFFSEATDVVMAGRYMLATEVAGEPFLRRKCRQTFRRLATISTSPTERGRSEIDFFHPLHGIQYLKRKPALDFLHSGDRTQFLKIVQAEKDGFITYTIHPPERVEEVQDGYGNFVEKWDLDLQVFLKGFEKQWLGASRTSKRSWEQERKKVLEEALVNFILPKLEDELRVELLAKARDEVVKQAADELYRRVMVGPFVRPGLSLEKQLLKPQRDVKVISVVCNDSFGRDRAACMVSLTANGALHDIYQFPELDTDDTRKKLRRFLIDSKPDLIVVNVSGATRSAMLAKRMYTHLQLALEEHKDSTYYDEDEDRWECKIMHLRDDIASIYSQSVRSEAEFLEQPEPVRMAVSLGRYAQNPLAETCAMWATMDEKGVCGREFMFLKLHPLQELVAPARLLRAYENKLITAVCSVGVDLNAAVEFQHLAGQLIFVAGLGPRKAAALRQGIQRTLKGVVTNRKDLLERSLMKTLVYTNCAGFLRITDKGNVADIVFNPFDATRIHPECYNTHDWASKICADALEVEHNSEDYFQTVEGVMDDSQEQLRSVLKDWERKNKKERDQTRQETERGRGRDRGEKQKPKIYDPDDPDIVELPDKLADLDLDSYAHMLEKQNLGKRLLQLEDIKSEIRFPYRDRRRPLSSPSDEELFEMLTGETDRTMRPGIIVQAQVTQVDEGKVKCVLDGSSIQAIIDKHNLKDDVPPNVALQFFRKTDKISAVIIEVYKRGITVKLSTKESDMKKLQFEWPVPESIFKQQKEERFFREERARQDYLHHLEELQKKIEPPKAEPLPDQGRGSQPTGPGYSIRSVVHPNFKNWTFADAERELRLSPAGEAVLRPSSKGADMLTISWVFQPGMIKHQEVKEEAKESDIGLGKRLLIKTDVYEDLDELISRFIDPMNDLVSDMIKYRKFRTESRLEVDEMLTKEKSENEQLIPYYFTIYAKQAGYFELSYIPNKSIKREVVAVTPDGLVLGDKKFQHVSDMVAWFKRNYQSLVYRQQRQRQQHQSPHHSHAHAQRTPPPPNSHWGTPTHGHNPAGLQTQLTSHDQPRGINNQPAWMRQHQLQGSQEKSDTGWQANRGAPMEVDTGYQRKRM